MILDFGVIFKDNEKCGRENGKWKRVKLTLAVLLTKLTKCKQEKYLFSAQFSEILVQKALQPQLFHILLKKDTYYLTLSRPLLRKLRICAYSSLIREKIGILVFSKRCASKI